VNPEFERQIGRLNVQLFSTVETQANEGDKKSWLALQRAVRRSNGKYAYLEIGSYVGGSIQPHLLDPNCAKIFSIDKRTFETPDDRASLDYAYQYENNVTERMLQNLRLVDSNQMSKIVCFDSDACEVSPAAIEQPADICFIDGEHTKAAVLSDFQFCLKVCAPNAAIYFHDADVIYPALAEIEQSLRTRNIPFVGLKLLGATYLIALRGSPVCRDSFVRSLATNGRRFIRQRQLAALVKRHLPQGFLLIGRTIGKRLLRLV